MNQTNPELQLNRHIYYHVVFPTYKRLPMFKDDVTKGMVIRLIETTILDRNINVLIYNLLSDHIHLLIHKQPHQTLSELIKYIKGRSTYYFYKQYIDYKIDLGRGKLWAKGYHANVIHNTHQLEHTIHYIHRNYDRHVD